MSLELLVFLALSGALLWTSLAVALARYVYLWVLDYLWARDVASKFRS